jgi:hypothetical protein
MTDARAPLDAGLPHLPRQGGFSWRSNPNRTILAPYAYGYAKQPCRAGKTTTPHPTFPSRRTECPKSPFLQASPWFCRWAHVPSTRTKRRPSWSNPRPHPSMSSRLAAKANTANLTRAIALPSRSQNLRDGLNVIASSAWRSRTPCCKLDLACAHSGRDAIFAASRSFPCPNSPPFLPLALFLCWAHARNIAQPPHQSLLPLSMSSRFRLRASKAPLGQAQRQSGQGCCAQKVLSC